MPLLAVLRLRCTAATRPRGVFTDVGKEGDDVEEAEEAIAGGAPPEDAQPAAPPRSSWLFASNFNHALRAEGYRSSQKHLEHAYRVVSPWSKACINATND